MDKEVPLTNLTKFQLISKCAKLGSELKQLQSSQSEAMEFAEFDKFVKDYKIQDKLFPKTEFIEDYAGGSSEFYGKEVIRAFFDGIHRTQSDAVEFANWAEDNYMRVYTEGGYKWFEKDGDNSIFFTTNELYDQWTLKGKP